MSLEPDVDLQGLAAEAGRIRDEIGSARSNTMLRLFDYLLERSSDGRSAKELEIAHAVFASRGSNPGQDSTVRVYVYKLRKKLDELYRGRTGPRLAIPKGEYRLTLVEHNPCGEGGPVETARPWDRLWSPRPFWWLIAAILLANIVVLAFLFSGWRSDTLSAPAQTFLWQPFVRDNRPTLIVAGDYYLIGNTANSSEVLQLVREFSINSREDLELYLMNNPNDMGRYVDIDLYYVPTSTAFALQSLFPVTQAIDRNKARPPALITSSKLTPELLRQSNIVYVGFLSSLRILREPLFQASGFSVGASYDELIDRATGKRYSADLALFDGKQRPQQDYGYVAAMPGPAGNRVLVVAGTRDAAVMQMAELVADAKQLDALRQRVGNDSFEALYRVRSIQNMNFDSSLVIARKLNTKGIWDGGKPDQQFPDSEPQNARIPRQQNAP